VGGVTELTGTSRKKQGQLAGPPKGRMRDRDGEGCRVVICGNGGGTVPSHLGRNGTRVVKGRKTKGFRESRCSKIVVAQILF